MSRPTGTRARRLGCVLLGSWLALTVVGMGWALASTTRTYRDNFDSVSYSGSNGTTAWSGNWLESGESDGPSSGRVRVVAQPECVAGSCARLSAGGNTTAGIHRRADLSGATSATLTFSYRRTKSGGAAGLVRVSVSSNGGSSWSTLATYTLEDSDPSSFVQSFGITPYISTQTQVRFRVESTPGQTGTLHFDNVQIAASFPDATTTTTSTSSTTTTTTTSIPPSSTTTIAPSSTSTTLVSTTTAPPSSTTTAPPSTTTTAPPPTTEAAPPTTEPLPPLTTIGAPSTPAAAGAPSPIRESSPYATAFPIGASEPTGSGAAPVEARVLNSTRPDVSDLVLAAMAEFVAEPDQPVAPEPDLLQAAAAGATEGAGSTMLTLMPVGLAALGLVVGRLSRRRR